MPWGNSTSSSCVLLLWLRSRASSAATTTAYLRSSSPQHWRWQRHRRSSTRAATVGSDLSLDPGSSKARHHGGVTWRGVIPQVTMTSRRTATVTASFGSGDGSCVGWSATATASLARRWQLKAQGLGLDLSSVFFYFENRFLISIHLINRYYK
jgi:hypothetical protein